MIYVCGPGHGGPGVVANTYLEGTYTEVYPDVSQDADGMRRLFKQFSFPGGIPSHAAPETPGSIHEGGELGYSLAHAYGAAFDNPDLLVACVVGDGEAETGPLATSWHSNKFLDPATDGAVLPILHLNGYKIANPTVLARIPEDELDELCSRATATSRTSSRATSPAAVHQLMAGDARPRARRRSPRSSARRARTGGRDRPRWPMIVLRTPKGWTGPKTVDGQATEGTWRAHQVPAGRDRGPIPSHLRQLEDVDAQLPARGAVRRRAAGCCPSWRRSPPPASAAWAPTRTPTAACSCSDLQLPDFRDYAVDVAEPGDRHRRGDPGARRVPARRDDGQCREPRNFRVFGPDETASNRLDALFEVTGRTWMAEAGRDDDEHLARDGRVMEILSEHLCQGWLEGYLLTGRHGLFSCYEAFIHIVDSMFNQHAKWLKTQPQDLDWRRPVASLNYLLTSHVWRQDHNGFTHQDPGFIDHVVNKKADVIRVYLPPDANTPAVGGRPLPAQPRLRQRHRRRQAAGAAVPRHGRRPSSTAPRGSASGSGPATTTAASRTWSWPAPATCRPSRSLAAVDLLREHFPDLKSGSSTWST